MEVGEEGLWVPPLRKYSGVPSLAAFRRTALTPWNSQDSTASNSPPHSPVLANKQLLQDDTKIKKNIVREATDKKSNIGKLSPTTGQVRLHSANNEESDGLRIDRLYKLAAENPLDRRRVKSSEPVRGLSPTSKSSNYNDGRDSVRIKNKSPVNRDHNCKQKKELKDQKNGGKESMRFRDKSPVSVKPKSFAKTAENDSSGSREEISPVNIRQVKSNNDTTETRESTPLNNKSKICKDNIVTPKKDSIDEEIEKINAQNNVKIIKETAVVNSRRGSIKSNDQSPTKMNCENLMKESNLPKQKSEENYSAKSVDNNVNDEADNLLYESSNKELLEENDLEKLKKELPVCIANYEEKINELNSVDFKEEVMLNSFICEDSSSEIEPSSEIIEEVIENHLIENQDIRENFNKELVTDASDNRIYTNESEADSLQNDKTPVSCKRNSRSNVKKRRKSTSSISLKIDHSSSIAKQNASTRKDKNNNRALSKGTNRMVNKLARGSVVRTPSPLSGITVNVVTDDNSNQDEVNEEIKQDALNESMETTNEEKDDILNVILDRNEKIHNETSSASDSEEDSVKDDNKDDELSPDDDSSSDETENDQKKEEYDEDKKDITDENVLKPNAKQGKKNMDTLDVPPIKRTASPQQIRVHGVTLTREKLKRLRSIVDKAAQRKKVFTIFGKYPSIREALLTRGWIQNFDLQKLTLPHARHNDNEVSMYAKLKLGTGVGEEELALISRMLRDIPVHFVWIMGDTVDWKSLSKTTIVSRFPRVYFTTKVGLCSYLEESHWFCEASVSHVNFPRCYTTDDLSAFVRDFRLTACLGLIRTLISAVDSKQSNIFAGKTPLSAIKFAVKRCSEFVSVEEHEDIDIESEERVWDHQWDQYLTYYYQVVHEGETFVQANDEQIQALYTCCKAAVEGVRPYWPQLEMDGLCNLWLVKPGAKSRGRGISVCSKLERIMAKLGSSHQPSSDINPPASSSRFVIQKYVERPLLIYNTKFDIRQWFLVTSAYPLTIWMYKESYLRFCSQLFSLNNLHESVHLTNNAVQCRYRNHPKRHKALPDENMWDSYTFQAYLRTLGRRDEWENVVYPGMRESITGALLAAQDHMEPRPNCFELYGADFILTEDLKPWLIEINSSPAMSATTSVTARMCPQCLEDIIKVVIDRRSNRDAPTGQFELIYRQNVSTPQPYMGMNLTVRGSAAPRGKVPPSTWSTPPDRVQSPSHHANIQTALDSLANHLANENDLLINSDERCASSLEGEEGSKESSERASRCMRKRGTEQRCSLYRKHSCLGPSSHRGFASFACTNRTHRLYKKQIRLNSVLLSMRRVSLAPTSDLLDWRQRVEHARAICSSAVAKMTGQNTTENPSKRPRTEWGRPRRSSRRKKTKERARSLDRLSSPWNRSLISNGVEILQRSPSDVGNYTSERNTGAPVSTSQVQNEKGKNRGNLSHKGKLYQEWKGKSSRLVDSEAIPTDDKTDDGFSKIKNEPSPRRTPRSLSPSMNSKDTRSLLAINRSRLIRTKARKLERSPSPSCRSLSPRVDSLTPRVDSLTPSYFDTPQTPLETKQYLSPLKSDINNNYHNLTQTNCPSPKYTFKSTSMINLPALLKTK